MTQLIDESDSTPKPIAILVSECQQQLKLFRLGKLSGDSISCTEIVHRAVAGDGEALMTLWAISQPMVESLCVAKNVGEGRELVVEEVRWCLIRRLHNRKKTFQVSGFAQYRKCLQVITWRIILKHLGNQSRTVSLKDYPSDAPDPANAYGDVELGLWFSKLLERLDNELEREAFRRYIGLEESYEEITRALNKSDPTITIPDVRRLIEYAKRRLRNDPFVRHLRQDLQ